jgi:hypothetical protein
MFIVNVSQAVSSGPASEAIEVSNKRLRSGNSSKGASSTSRKTFNLDALFDAVTEEDPFPTIGWDIDERSVSTYSMSSSSVADSMSSDDDDEDYKESDYAASFQSKKRARSCMLRSRSIMTDLSLLSPSSDHSKRSKKKALLQIRKYDALLMSVSSSSQRMSVAACAS